MTALYDGLLHLHCIVLLYVAFVHVCVLVLFSMNVDRVEE